MKKLLALVVLAVASTSQAAWTDVVKKFETPENAMCKAIRTFAEGKYSDTKPPEFYGSYRVNDMYLEQAGVIFANAMYFDKIQGTSLPLSEIIGGMYSRGIIYNNKVYRIYLDPVSKYSTDVCVTISPSG